MLTVVIDTNVLLQCRPLESLDWHSLDPEGVHLIIPLACVHEIDRAKQSGNSRRAKKARAFTPMFAKAVTAPFNAFQFEGLIGCTWSVGSGSHDWHEELARDWPDHRILAEALHIAKTADGPSVFLSGDQGMLIVGSRIGLRILATPEGWKLPPERDPREKEIEALRKELRSAKSERPDVELTAIHNGQVFKDLSKRFDFFCPASSDDLDDLLHHVQELHPPAEKIAPVGDREHILSMVGHGTLVHPSEEDFRRYRDKHYPAWLAQLRSDLLRLPEALSRPSRCVAMSLFIENKGEAPALAPIFEYEVHGGASFLPLHELDQARVLAAPALPLPPKPPKPSIRQTDWGAQAPLPQDDFHLPDDRSRRDPYAFYAAEHYNELATKHSWECNEFRHGRKETFEVTVLLPSNTSGECTLVCTVTARNMPAVRNVVKLRFEGTQHPSIETLKGQLPSNKAPVTLRLPSSIEMDPGASA